jgi:hypothetical protein
MSVNQFVIFSAQDDYWVARLGTLRRGATVLSPYEQVIKITHIFLHPQYQNVGFVNDVSLLRLEKEVNFTDYVRPVCLATPENKIRDGRMCTGKRTYIECKYHKANCNFL